MLLLALFARATSYTPPLEETRTKTNTISVVQVNTNRVLRTVAAVRRLSRDEAKAAIPVQLRGVITYWGPRWHCFLNDETGGLFLAVKLSEKRDAKEPAVGDLVEVTGVTDPGDFAPIVAAPAIRVVGQGQ